MSFHYGDGGKIEHCNLSIKKIKPISFAELRNTILLLPFDRTMSCFSNFFVRCPVTTKSAHLFGGLPKGLDVFGFSLYAALASLSFPILSTCSLHSLLSRDHLIKFGIPSHRSRILLLFCLSLSVTPTIARRALILVVRSALFVRLVSALVSAE